MKYNYHPMYNRLPIWSDDDFIKTFFIPVSAHHHAKQPIDNI